MPQSWKTFLTALSRSTWSNIAGRVVITQGVFAVTKTCYIYTIRRFCSFTSSILCSYQLAIPRIKAVVSSHHLCSNRAISTRTKVSHTHRVPHNPPSLHAGEIGRNRQKSAPTSYAHVRQHQLQTNKTMRRAQTVQEIGANPLPPASPTGACRTRSIANRRAFSFWRGRGVESQAGWRG
jgi:hypothetical protein